MWWVPRSAWQAPMRKKQSRQLWEDTHPSRQEETGRDSRWRRETVEVVGSTIWTEYGKWQKPAQANDTLPGGSNSSLFQLGGTRTREGGQAVFLPGFGTKCNKGTVKRPNKPTPWVERKVCWGIKTARLSLRDRENSRSGGKPSQFWGHENILGPRVVTLIFYRFAWVNRELGLAVPLSDTVAGWWWQGDGFSWQRETCFTRFLRNAV